MDFGDRFGDLDLDRSWGSLTGDEGGVLAFFLAAAIRSCAFLAASFLLASSSALNAGFGEAGGDLAPPEGNRDLGDKDLSLCANPLTRPLPIGETGGDLAPLEGNRGLGDKDLSFGMVVDSILLSAF